MTKEFTGKHMLAVFVMGFGIVMAVNFFMASLATGGFSGVVVKNSYVASQNYNGWLAAAEKQRALGWEAAVSRNDTGKLQIATLNTPAEITINAELERPLGDPERHAAILSNAGNGLFITDKVLPAGRWIVRLQITSDGDVWRQQSEIR